MKVCVSNLSKVKWGGQIRWGERKNEVPHEWRCYIELPIIFYPHSSCIVHPSVLYRLAKTTRFSHYGSFLEIQRWSFFTFLSFGAIRIELTIAILLSHVKFLIAAIILHITAYQINNWWKLKSKTNTQSLDSTKVSSFH